MKIRIYIIITTLFSLVSPLLYAQNIKPGKLYIGRRLVSEVDSAAMAPRIIDLKNRKIRPTIVNDGNNPIVDRKFNMGMEVDIFPTYVADELRLSPYVAGTEEFADGTVVRDTLFTRTSGSTNVNSFLMHSFSGDRSYNYDKAQEKYDADFVYNNGRWCYTISREYDNVIYDVYATEYHYKLLKNYDKLLQTNLLKWTSFALGGESKEWQIGPVVDYFIRDLNNYGINPYDFDQQLFMFNPCVRYDSRVSDMETDWNVLSYEVNLYFRGAMFVEGGFGENCKSMTMTKLPKVKNYYTIRNRLSDLKGHMDGWEINVILEVNYYDCDYVYKLKSKIYLPYPQDEEHKEAAILAGYVVP